MGLEEQIKRAMSTGTVVLGTKKTEKTIMLGKAKYVFYSQDLDDAVKERLVYLLELGNIKNKEMPYTYKAFGEVLGQGFPVGALAVVSEGKALFDLDAKEEPKKKIVKKKTSKKTAKVTATEEEKESE